MDGVHDLGGREGFGPIDTGPGDRAFAHDWERRMWGMARGGALPAGVTIDWFRHGLERMVPGDYLTFSYFQKWSTNYLALNIDAGAVSLAEVRAGHAAAPGAPASARSVADVLATNCAGNRSFAVEVADPPRFASGDVVRTRRRVAAAHTRLPAYAAEAEGRVSARHGAHLFADDGARGIERGEHLYTVVFAAPELWGAEADPRDEVSLDLFESYLVPA